MREEHTIKRPPAPSLSFSNVVPDRVKLAKIFVNINIIFNIAKVKESNQLYLMPRLVFVFYKYFSFFIPSDNTKYCKLKT